MFYIPCIVSGHSSAQITPEDDVDGGLNKLPPLSKQSSDVLPPLSKPSSLPPLHREDIKDTPTLPPQGTKLAPMSLDDAWKQPSSKQLVIFQAIVLHVDLFLESQTLINMKMHIYWYANNH